jgi:hypothetical protein
VAARAILFGIHDPLGLLMSAPGCRRRTAADADATNSPRPLHSQAACSSRLGPLALVDPSGTPGRHCQMTRVGRNRNVRCAVRNVNKQTFVHEHCQRQLSTQASQLGANRQMPKADVQRPVALAVSRRWRSSRPSLPPCARFVGCLRNHLHFSSQSAGNPGSRHPCTCTSHRDSAK